MSTIKMSNKLTPREVEILYLVANGYSNSEIASILFLSPHTIKVIVTSILRKLSARNRAQAVFIAAYSGVLKGGKTSRVQSVKQKI